MTSFALSITLTILLFISPILLTTANAYSVRDFKGRKVINGANYYIRPNMPRPDEASITWAYNASSNQNCPLFVTQGYDNNITPATISTYPSSKYIPLSVNVFITFQDNTTPCNNELSWSVTQTDSIADATVYVAAGYQFPVSSGSFQFVDAGINQKNVYKFTFCDGYACGDVGWLANSSDHYLAITTDPTVELNPFYFVLVQAF